MARSALPRATRSRSSTTAPWPKPIARFADSSAWTMLPKSSSADPAVFSSQLAELQDIRVLLEETGLLAGTLAYHRRAKIDARFDPVLFEIERQIQDLRANRG